MLPLESHLYNKLNQTKLKKHWRKRTPCRRLSDGRIDIDGVACWDFSSSDHLNLRFNSELIQAARKAYSEYGCGSGGSPFVTGYETIHETCENAFAMFLKRDKALLFANGFAANIGVIQSLADKDTIIFADHDCHASILDGVKQSGARCIRFSHLNYDHLETLLTKHRDTPSLIVTESTFSMFGTRADLKRLSELAKTYQSLLIVDEAHSLGLEGPNGRGAVIAQELTQDDVAIIICPLSKTFAASGAIVAGKAPAVTAIEQYARSLRYSTALPAFIASQLLTTIDVISKAEKARAALQYRIETWQELVKNYDQQQARPGSAIQTWQVGEENTALEMTNQLWQQGFWVQAMRPPSVPPGKSLLRVTLNARHTNATLRRLVKGCQACLTMVAPEKM